MGWCRVRVETSLGEDHGSDGERESGRREDGCWSAPAKSSTWLVTMR